MNAIIVDDEPHNIENLQILLERHCPDINIVATADHIDEAINIINTRKPDVVFLDIVLGKQTGFDLLARLTEKNFEVIFVTAYDQYGVRAVKSAALDYLLKPVDIAELKASVDKASEKIKQKKKNTQLDFLMEYITQKDKVPGKVALPLRNEVRYIEINDIVRCEATNSYTWFYLKNKEKILVSKSLKEYDDLFNTQGFIRCHQSHLINISFVKSMLREDSGALLMQDGEKIPISKAKKDMVKLALAKSP
ncbi:LytR/AlgR family response regulator transcription factor [Niabella hibiscisoli]|uniref:LytR/AlgR family response regulator transcription factor n=1 Tax=Niabella hibiscisoli TaxID=1825928 RepID=UPI001F0FF8DB|nr:LytTR family DNA-binding domain-containing protein [Niabella hibiscisoli]MCH5715804.1 LytTR family DNA-binding domain-containing protein [Niabella hibiscisoli]